MNRAIQNEKLSRLIVENGQSSLNAKQVAQRLKTLLPLRFREIKREYVGKTRTMTGADRAALADERYESYLEELVEISSQGVHARIKYETYNMLLKARQTLCLLNRS